MTRRGSLRALLALLDDADGAFGSGKGLVASQEREALGLLAQQHSTQVAVTKTDLPVVGNGAVDAEGLQAFADLAGSVRRRLDARLQGDGRADTVSPSTRFRSRWAGCP